MRHCPLHLEACALPECAAGYCAASCEPTLYVCAECGEMGPRMTVARVGVCMACAELPHSGALSVTGERKSPEGKGRS